MATNTIMVPTRIRFLIIPLLSAWHCGPKIAFSSWGDWCSNMIFMKGVELSPTFFSFLFFFIRFTVWSRSSSKHNASIINYLLFPIFCCCWWCCIFFIIIFFAFGGFWGRYYLFVVVVVVVLLLLFLLVCLFFVVFFTLRHKKYLENGKRRSESYSLHKEPLGSISPPSQTNPPTHIPTPTIPPPPPTFMSLLWKDLK